MREENGQWMAVEVMGHRQHVGRVLEVSRFGATFMQVDELQRDGTFKRLTYGGSAVFSFRAVTEEEARRHVLPKDWRACFSFKQPSARPGYCSDCGHDEAAHQQAPALPAAPVLSEPERRVLHILQVQEDEDRPGLSAQEISEALDLSPNDTDAALSLLSARGKVERDGIIGAFKRRTKASRCPTSPRMRPPLRRRSAAGPRSTSPGGGATY